MLKEERYQAILQLLKQQRVAQLKEFVDALNSSEATIRRDLSALEELGKLERVHGGAKLPPYLEPELDMHEKEQRNPLEKEAIARWAASLIKESDTLFLDAGTTTAAVIPYLETIPQLVVTNGLRQADLLGRAGIQTILLGGLLKPGTNAIVGVTASEQLRQYRFTKAFLGMNSIDVKNGLTTPTPEEAAIKHAAIAFSQEAYVLADASKFNTTSFARVGNLEEVTLITNPLPPSIRKIYKPLTTIMEVKE